MNATHFQKLIIPLQDKLFRFAWSILKNRPESEDVVQEVVMKLWERKEQLAELENPEAWLMRATRNKCIDIIRGKGRNNASLETAMHIRSKEQSPERIAESNDTMERIQAMMEDLNETQRSVLTLRDIEGYQYDEISDVLELTLSQVKINLHRARKKMREKLIKENIHGKR